MAVIGRGCVYEQSHDCTPLPFYGCSSPLCFFSFTAMPLTTFPSTFVFTYTASAPASGLGRIGSGVAISIHRILTTRRLRGVYPCLF